MPSRLQSPRRLRVAVKDVFRINGLKTSLCNTSYYRLSSPAKQSADVVQRLIDRGHHILGLTKLSSMIAREEPLDAVDFQTAFNPRGEGYLSPAGSSSGSAAAVAFYEWLDCALGTDTSGSGRRPALVCGGFQFRPSHELVPLGGMVRTFLRFDTPCVFGRNLEVLEEILSAWVPRTDRAARDAPDHPPPPCRDHIPAGLPADFDTGTDGHHRRLRRRPRGAPRHPYHEAVDPQGLGGSARPGRTHHLPRPRATSRSTSGT